MRSFPVDNNESASNNYTSDISNTNGALDFSCPCIQPGDAILSINGIAVSSFSSTQQLANFIRQFCQQKMTLVIMRHQFVWKTTRLAIALEERNKKLEIAATAVAEPLQERNKHSVANSVKKSWMLLNSLMSVNNNYNININSNNNNNNKATAPTIRKNAAPPPQKKRKISEDLYDNRQLYNPMFKDKDGNPILYCDNDDFEPDDGKRIHMFLNDEIERDFNGWLKKRKATWREKWKLSVRTSASIVEDDDDEERGTVVGHNFWLSSGYESFDQWLVASKTKWRRSYSWHVNRRNQLEEECEKTVHLPYSPLLENTVAMEQFRDWLIVRKQQWRISRRKRQRRQHHAVVDVPTSLHGTSPNGSVVVDRASSNATTSEATSKVNTNSKDTMYIDEMLEKQEEYITNAAEKEKQQPMDVSWIFDSQLGAPDDVVLVIMKYLQPFEQGNLLCLSYTSNILFKQRETMWKSLCPKHWVLPRRPRKSWCVLYITKIRAEEEAARKRSDDLLVKANAIIEKGDLLNKLEKLVNNGEKDFRFDVNYTSGVVLERNSLLNMAIIDKRTKIAKWLMEQKNADIETWDRGQFTPLLNAAWNGDKHMVRYLLARGADRTKTGLNHSSKGLAPAGFMGLRAEEWARQRGHDDVAELIRIGI
jgi:hypothetical protein